MKKPSILAIAPVPFALLFCSACGERPDSPRAAAGEPWRTAEARSRGRAVYLAHCALCHGERADGRGVRREGLSSAPRDFTDPRWRRSARPEALYKTIREGVRGTPMAAWPSFDEKTTWDLVAYLMSAGETP
jgi:mono/diheme cytochrome c family protein